MRRWCRWAAAGSVGCMLATASPAALVGASQSVPDRGALTYTWPVRGPVIRDFDPPDDPYGAGHRGIDIATTPGTVVKAAASGTVAFAGKIGAGLYVSVDHPDGIRTTYSFLGSITVRRDQVVALGAPLGRAGTGHVGSSLPPHLHLGAKRGDVYLDPLEILPRPSLAGWIRLLPSGV